jgi:hypothetical protein
MREARLRIVEPERELVEFKSALGRILPAASRNVCISAGCIGWKPCATLSACC